MHAQDYLHDEASTFDSILCKYEFGVLWVTLNRTIALNAIDCVMADQLRNLWSSMRALPEADTIVISAAGSEAFCIGFDPTRPPRADTHHDQDRDFSVPITPKEYRLAQRVVVAVNGIACREAFRFLRDADVVIAASNASFFEPRAGLPEGNTASEADGRARAIRAVAAEEATLSDPVTAQQAKDAGLVQEVVSGRRLRDAVSQVVLEDYRAQRGVGLSVNESALAHIRW